MLSQNIPCYRYARTRITTTILYSSPTSAIPLPSPPSSRRLDVEMTEPPFKPSWFIFIHFPPPPAQGELVLDGVDAVADGGENDKENDDDDCDDDVALDHGCDVGVVEITRFVWEVV